MIELDGDEIRISSRGRYAERDIVQVQVHVLFLKKLFLNLKDILNRLIFLNQQKYKYRTVRGQSGGSIWKGRAVCVQDFYIFYGKQLKQHLSHIGGCSELSPGHLNPWMFWITDGMMHTHGANGTAPASVKSLPNLSLSH